VSDSYGDSEESLKWEARYNRESIIFFKQSALRYWPIANKIIPWLDYAYGVTGV